MSILGLILVIAVFGLLVYIITLLPIPQPFLNIIIALALLGVVLYLLHAFGVIHGGPPLY